MSNLKVGVTITRDRSLPAGTTLAVLAGRTVALETLSDADLLRYLHSGRAHLVCSVDVARRLERRLPE